MAAPFVVARPGGARVRTRLKVDDTDAVVLAALGAHLGSLAGADLAKRCREGCLDAKARTASRATRKRGITKAASSRWAGAITRTSEDAFSLGYRNLIAEERSLRSRVVAINRRLAIPAGGRRGRVRGYATGSERFEKQRRLQALTHRLDVVQARIDQGRVSVCRGTKALARTRHHLEEAGMTEAEWQNRWKPARWFITADGEKDKAWGNETIRFNPDEQFLEIKLPAALSQLSNRAHSRYRLSCPVSFSYRADEVAAQAASAAVRYDIIFDPDRSRWYLDASWKCASGEDRDIAELREHRVVGVDVNAGHLAAVVVDPSGNPFGQPVSVALDLGGLAASTRDAHLRSAISTLLGLARANNCRVVVIEDLDFSDARELGRDRAGRRPSRGKRAKSFRRLVSGIPTARFRDRLVQMAANAGVAVIAVDPAYTSRWGAEHWLGALRQISPTASGHHAAALVIGRRGLAQRARRRERCDSTPPVDGPERAANSAVWAMPADAGLCEPCREPRSHQARGQPHQRQKTRPAERAQRGDQVAQDRSGPPAGRNSLPLGV